MLTLIFAFMLLGFVGKVLWLAFKATWGLTKVLMYIVFAPLLLLIFIFPHCLLFALLSALSAAFLIVYIYMYFMN